MFNNISSIALAARILAGWLLVTKFSDILQVVKHLSVQCCLPVRYWETWNGIHSHWHIVSVRNPCLGRRFFLSSLSESMKKISYAWRASNKYEVKCYRFFFRGRKFTHTLTFRILEQPAFGSLIDLNVSTVRMAFPLMEYTTQTILSRKSEHSWNQCNALPFQSRVNEIFVRLNIVFAKLNKCHGIEAQKQNPNRWWCECEREVVKEYLHINSNWNSIQNQAEFLYGCECVCVCLLCTCRYHFDLIFLCG